jgi:hypothetical protein
MPNAYIEHDRRQSPRVACQVALTQRPISEDEFTEQLEHFDAHRHRLVLLDSIVHPPQQEIEQFMAVQKRDADVAALLQGMSAKLEALGRLVMQPEERLSTRPTHNVVFSATGMQFHAPVQYGKGHPLDLQFRLFPSRRRIVVLAEVVSCREGSGSNHAIAVSFTYISDDDRQFLREFVEDRLKSMDGGDRDD